MIIGLSISLLLLIQLPDSWQEHARMEDETHFFYTGMSSPNENERQAREEAVSQARSAFLFEHFGVHFQVDERVYSNLGEQSVTQDLSLRSPEHFLVGERIESIERRNKITYILLSYPKLEIAKQKATLGNRVPQRRSTERSSETNRSGAAELGVLSSPEGALVYLNGMPIGTTPLRARGLQEGAADIELVLPLHRPIKRQVILSSGSPLKIDEKLEAEFGVLDLEVVPKTARVKIEKIYDGSASGLKSLRLPAGEQRISVTHSNYEEQQVTIFVRPKAQSYRLIELAPKPSKISMVSNQYPFKASMFDADDNKKVVEIEDNQIHLIEPIYKRLVAQKQGFENFEVRLNLIPNAASTLNITFVPGQSKPIEHSNSRKSRSIFRNPWFWGGIVVAGILTGVLVSAGGGGGGDSSSSTSSGPSAPGNTSGSGGVKIDLQ
ncbi:MAG: hypothetical protein COV44_11830 [Deltaproteobacteria bacterium CG11_big_fil_rev_8_21_14_0_20_45_16]|nr:MAG: hypothetical protein COV44_11830 [Deltaproteobacteria bacterium CG11_big_fil_rev_8_21_14_0_20_45_16]